MEGLASLFMLFVVAIIGLLTYVIVPFTPTVVLMLLATAGLAAGLWWHWTQFSVDYRTSTWQEQLRNYASYVMVAVVIAASYTFYVFGWGGVSGYVTDTVESVRSATADAVSEVTGNIGEAAGTALSVTYPNRNRSRNSNITRNGGILGNLGNLGNLGGGVGNLGAGRNVALE
jgi:hypothetical protein